MRKSLQANFSPTGKDIKLFGTTSHHFYKYLSRIIITDLIFRRNDGRHRPVAKTPTWQVEMQRIKSSLE